MRLSVYCRDSLFWAMSFLLCLSIGGCSEKMPDNQQLLENKQKKVVSDKPLAEFQTQLLEMAFESASAIPEKPHMKDKCQVQEKVVDTCLGLDQPVRAVKYSDSIKNWRRGLCYANTAYYLAEKGFEADQIQKGLELAEQIAAIDHGQQWRSDRIYARIEQAKQLIDKNQQAVHLIQTEAMVGEDDSFDELVKKLDDSIALMDIDITLNAFDEYARLFDRFYDYPQRQSLAEERIKTSGGRVPVIIRIEMLIKIAQIAFDHKDSAKALSLTNNAMELMDQYQWPLEKKIPVMSDILTIRFKAGETEKSLADAGALLELYEADSSQVLFTRRVETLLPLAQAYQAMEKSALALSVYKRVVQEIGPNYGVKLCAESVSTICCSLAVNAVEPDTELWLNLRNINNALGS